MGFLWLTARKDWRTYWRSPLQVAIWIGVPLLVGMLIIVAFGGRSGPRPQAHVLIADHDDSVLSRFLIGALSQEASGSLVRAETVDEEEGRRRMRMGGASALLVIPEGFGQAVLREEPTTLQLLLNPAQRFLPQIVDESVSMFAEGAFYVQRLLGDQLRLIAENSSEGGRVMPDAFVASFAVRINQLMSDIIDRVDPPLIKLQASDPAERGEKTGPGFAMFFVPGILFMSLIFMAQGMGDEIWHEKTKHTLHRVLSTPRGATAFLAGKLLAGAWMMGLVSCIALIVGYLYFRLPVWTLPLSLVWSTAAGVMMMALMVLIQLFAHSQRAGNIITFVLVWPLIMTGGSFFPIEALPAWMAAVGRHTPNGWALGVLKDVLLREATVPQLAMGFGIVIVATAALFAIAARRLRGGFATGG